MAVRRRIASLARCASCCSPARGVSARRRRLPPRPRTSPRTGSKTLVALDRPRSLAGRRLRGGAGRRADRDRRRALRPAGRHPARLRGQLARGAALPARRARAGRRRPARGRGAHRPARAPRRCSRCSSCGGRWPSGRWDVVVVDCAPTGETLRLLALPEALRWWMQRMFPPERRVLRTLRPVLTHLAGLPLPPDAVFAAVERLLDRAGRGPRPADRPGDDLGAPGAHPRGASSSPRPAVPSPRSRCTATGSTAWSPTGSSPTTAATDDAGGPAGSRPSATSSPRSRRRSPGCRSGEPRTPRPSRSGSTRCRRSRDTTYADTDPLALVDTPDPLIVERVAAGRVRACPSRCRTPSAREIDLVRKGDDLVLTVGGHRRLLALPSALRRCVIDGAALRDGRLRVRFRADPDLWMQLVTPTRRARSPRRPPGWSRRSVSGRGAPSATFRWPSDGGGRSARSARCASCSRCCVVPSRRRSGTSPTPPRRWSRRCGRSSSATTTRGHGGRRGPAHRPATGADVT